MRIDKAHPDGNLRRDFSILRRRLRRRRSRRLSHRDELSKGRNPSRFGVDNRCLWSFVRLCLIIHSSSRVNSRSRWNGNGSSRSWRRLLLTRRRTHLSLNLSLGGRRRLNHSDPIFLLRFQSRLRRSSRRYRRMARRRACPCSTWGWTSGFRSRLHRHGLFTNLSSFSLSRFRRLGKSSFRRLW